MAKRPRIRELKADFDAAHRKGMKGLATGDYDAMAEAVDAERQILAEQSAIIDDHLARTSPHLRPPKRRR